MYLFLSHHRHMLLLLRLLLPISTRSPLKLLLKLSQRGPYSLLHPRRGCRTTFLEMASRAWIAICSRTSNRSDSRSWAGGGGCCYAKRREGGGGEKPWFFLAFFTSFLFFLACYISHPPFFLKNEGGEDTAGNLTSQAYCSDFEPYLSKCLDFPGVGVKFYYVSFPFYFFTSIHVLLLPLRGI